MSEKKLIRYSVTVAAFLVNPATFTANIYVPFTPDQMKVKQIGFQLGGTAGVYSLVCDSLTGQAGASLGLFCDPAISYCGLTYDVGRPINGQHTFKCVDASGSTSTILNTGDFMVHLEFRKWV